MLGNFGKADEIGKKDGQRLAFRPQPNLLLLIEQ